MDLTTRMDRIADAADLLAAAGATGTEATAVSLRLVGLQSLEAVGNAVDMSPAMVRQTEMRVLRTLPADAFDALTAMIREVRGAEWHWHPTVGRMRQV